MRLCILIVLILAGTLPSAAAQPKSARVTALGGASTAILGTGDITSNPASWSSPRRLSLALSAAQLYGMPELRAASARVLVPVGTFSVVAGASTFGFNLYRETGFVFGLARSFQPGTHRSVHVGLRLQQTLVRIPGYDGTSIPTISAGLIVPILPALSLGATADNVVVLKPRAEAERSLALGLSYTHNARVMVATDILKEVRSPATVRIGVEAYLADPLALRAGLTSEPPRASGGIGLRTAHLIVDAAAEHHYALGWTPVLSVAIRW